MFKHNIFNTTMNKAATTNSSEPPRSPSTNTTFVQLADPSTFREIVQKLTGAQNLPPINLSLPQTRSVTKPDEIPGLTRPRRPAFKLHERRQNGGAARNLQLQLKLNSIINLNNYQNSVRGFLVSPVSTLDFIGGGEWRCVGCPSSPSPATMGEDERAIDLDFFGGGEWRGVGSPSPSPATLEGNEKAIALDFFSGGGRRRVTIPYSLSPASLKEESHRSWKSSPPVSPRTPELLALFPLQSPRDHDYN